MPITIQITENAPKSVQTWMIDHEPMDTDDFLVLACPQTRSEPLLAVQSSNLENAGPSANGFFHTFLNAYNQHHHIKIRADDVWIAIITQLSNYIQSQESPIKKRNMTVMSDHPVSYAKVVEQFVEMIAEQFEIDWMIPNFSTTTDTDRTVALIIVAATMQRFLDYNLVTYCGIPSITLLGCSEDYEALLSKLNHIYTLGEEPSRFADLLKPIISNMILSFSDPIKTQEFWSKSIDKENKRSGQMVLSGWMTAFCFWDKDGKCQYDITWPEKDSPLTLDGAVYQPIRAEDVTVGCSRMPVTMIDLGQKKELHLFAGTMGIACSSSNGDEIDTVMPKQAWFVCETT